MARRDEYRLELRVGLLMLIGLVTLVGIILVSERFSFERDYEVTALLRDAGGLRNGSPVTLAGLPIGKVKDINTDSGESRFPVKVTLAIKETYRLPAASTLSVATSGIFGDAYLAFSGTGAPTGDFDLLPIDGSAKVYATRGFVDTATQQSLDLLERLNDLLDATARTDAKRLLHATADLAEESTAFVREMRVQTAGVGALVERLDVLAQGVDASQRQLAPKVEATLDQLAAVATRAESAIAAAERALASVDTAAGAVETLASAHGPAIGELLTELQQSVAALGQFATAARSGDGLLGRLFTDRQLARDVSDAALNLAQVSDLLLTKPEVLVFGLSNDDQIRWRQRRDALRMRRTFQEGFAIPPEPHLPVPSLIEQAQEHADQHPR